MAHQTASQPPERQWTLRQRPDGAWWLTTDLGDVREHPDPRALAALIFGDLAHKPETVAVAEWLAERVAEAEIERVATRG